MTSLAIGAAVLIAASAAGADDIELRSLSQIIRISSHGGLPSAWTGCAGVCAETGPERRHLVGAGQGSLRWVADDPDAAAAMTAVTYTAAVTETAEAVTAVLTAADTLNGIPLTQRYELSRRGHSLRVRLMAPPGVGLRIRTGPGFVPPPLPGVGAAFSDVETVRVNGDGQQVVASEVGRVGEFVVAPADWFGIRARFWAWLARPAAATEVVADRPAENAPYVTWRSPGGGADLTFFAGPIEWKSLRVVSPDLTQMLFAALWEPLRWLCYGLLFLLAFITRFVGNAGLAIILLSLAAKVILWPLTRLADRWQQDVNRIQSRLQPRINDIKRRYRGEEAHNLVLQVYRDEGVHPMFTLRSLAGFAIQVPMFIAAFDMLADNYALSGESFLWVSDLAVPDRFMPLPFTVPFFGADLNLLPAIMTLFTVLSALTQRDDSLSPALAGRQRLQLYLMAAAFFLLFYTFPAGMVLYWTANNFWHFVKIQLTAWAAQAR